LNFLCLSVNGETVGILSEIQKQQVPRGYRDIEDDHEYHPPKAKARYWRDLEMKKQKNAYPVS
jgi:hypothetical protein